MADQVIEANVLVWSDGNVIPNSPGVYAFHNVSPGAIYIGAAGNMRRRFHQWRSCIVSETVPLRADGKMRQEIAIAPRNGWRFTVLVAASDETTRADLLKMERDAIHRTIEAKGDRCLNHITYLKR